MYMHNIAIYLVILYINAVMYGMTFDNVVDSIQHNRASFIWTFKSIMIF